MTPAEIQARLDALHARDSLGWGICIVCREQWPCEPSERAQERPIYRAHVNYIADRFGHRAVRTFDALSPEEATNDARIWIGDQPAILWAVVSPPFEVKENQP